MQHKHLQVFGTVQGVGFRYYTQKIAQKYNIVGTVQNYTIEEANNDKQYSEFQSI